MESKSSKSRNYFRSSFIMFLGLIYNVIEQDLFGTVVFLISSVVLLSLGLIRNRTTKIES